MKKVSKNKTHPYAIINLEESKNPLVVSAYESWDKRDPITIIQDILLRPVGALSSNHPLLHNQNILRSIEVSQTRVDKDEDTVSLTITGIDINDICSINDATGVMEIDGSIIAEFKLIQEQAHKETWQEELKQSLSRKAGTKKYQLISLKTNSQDIETLLVSGDVSLDVLIPQSLTPLSQQDTESLSDSGQISSQQTEPDETEIDESSEIKNERNECFQSIKEILESIKTIKQVKLSDAFSSTDKYQLLLEKVQEILTIIDSSPLAEEEKQQLKTSISLINLEEERALAEPVQEQVAETSNSAGNKNSSIFNLIDSKNEKIKSIVLDSKHKPEYSSSTDPDKVIKNILLESFHIQDTSRIRDIVLEKPTKKEFQVQYRGQDKPRKFVKIEYPTIVVKDVGSLDEKVARIPGKLTACFEVNTVALKEGGKPQKTYLLKSLQSIDEPIKKLCMGSKGIGNEVVAQLVTPIQELTNAIKGAKTLAEMATLYDKLNAPNLKCLRDTRSWSSDTLWSQCLNQIKTKIHNLHKAGATVAEADQDKLNKILSLHRTTKTTFFNCEFFKPARAKLLADPKDDLHCFLS